MSTAMPRAAAPAAVGVDSAAVEAESGYGGMAIALHWLIGLALLGQVVFGFLLDDLAPRGTPARASVINLHKSLGICLGLLVVARLLWRLGHRPPACAASMAAWQRRSASIVHAALYVCMLAMPLSAYIASNFSKHGVRFFGTRFAPLGPDLPRVYDFFNGLHVALAWLFCALVAFHVLAALKHALIDRDAVFRRMWPRAGR